MLCPHCACTVGNSDTSCGSCGKSLLGNELTNGGSNPTPCSCGSTQFDADNFCRQCGKKMEIFIPITCHVVDDSLAWASHPGRVHRMNQDAAGVRRLESGMVAMVVSDGVSSADHADEAAHEIVDTILTELEVNQYGYLGKALLEAIQKADQRVKLIPHTNPSKAEPEATVAVAVVHGQKVHFAWVGDSRVYLLNARESRQLSVDDSWVNKAVKAGMPLETALAHRNVHCITQSLGMRESSARLHYACADLAPDSWVVLCTDGLWGYFNAPSALIEQMPTVDLQKSALDICKHWVDAANLRGGQDNVTVAVYHVTSSS